MHRIATRQQTVRISRNGLNDLITLVKSLHPINEDWDIQTIETGIGADSTLDLAFTSGSIPYVAYHHTPSGTVLPHCKSEWDIVTTGAEGSDLGYNLQMAIDGEDRVHLSFYNSTNGNIWYAMGHWSISFTL